LKPYNDSTFLVERSNFYSVGNAYFKAVVTSDAGNSAIASIGITTLTLLNQSDATNYFDLVTNQVVTQIGNTMGYKLYPNLTNNAVGFSYSLSTNYTAPQKNSFSIFTVKVTLNINYISSKKRQSTALQTADSESQVLLVPPLSPITKLDVILLSILVSIGGALIIGAAIFGVVRYQKVLEHTRNRHDAIRKFTGEIINKFTSNPVDFLPITQSLPDWVSRWQVALTSTEIKKKEVEFKKQAKNITTNKKTKKMFKYQNLLGIANIILDEQKKYREQNGDSDVDDGSSLSYQDDLTEQD